MGCWTDALSLSPSVHWRPLSVPHNVGLHEAAHNVAADFIRLREQEKTSLTEATALSFNLCNFDIPSSLLFSSRSKSASPSCTPGEGWHKGTNIRGHGAWVPCLRLPLTGRKKLILKGKRPGFRS